MNEENTGKSTEEGIKSPGPDVDESGQETPPEPKDKVSVDSPGTPAPTPETTVGNESKEVRIGRIAQDINRTYFESLGDNSQVNWENTAVEERELIVEGVRFHINHPNASASSGHEKWLDKKRVEGWKFGKIKNEEAREHPFFLPFADLPKEEKGKYFIFKAVVNGLA